MTPREPNKSPPLHKRLPASIWVALATLLTHSIMIWLSPATGAFRKYGLAAEQFLSGQLPNERLMDFSPLYLELSIFFERLFDHPETVLLGFQLGIVAISMGLFYHVLRRRFSAQISGLAVAVMVIDRHVLVYEQILEPEVFVLLFLMAVLFFLDRDLPLIAGLGAALSLLTRPNLLPIFLLVPLDLYFRGWRSGQLARKALMFLLPLIAAFALLMFRAESITGDPTTPVMNPGTVFFEGNNPLSQGTSAVYPPVVLAYVQRGEQIPDSAHQHYRTVARAEMGKELSVAEVNAFWAEKALHFIAQEPGHFARLLLEKLVRSFHNFRWHDVPTAWQHDRSLLVPPVPFALISALGLLGLLFEAPRWRQSLLFYALILTQLGVMLVFYVSARQRLLLLPALLYFAAIAVRELRSRKKGRPMALVLIALMTLALVLPNDLTRDERYRRYGLIETDNILRQFRPPAQPEPLALHTELVLAALASSPWWLEWIRPAGLPQDDATLEDQLADLLEKQARSTPSARFDRAILQFKAGRYEAAEVELEALRQQQTVFYRKAFAPSDPLFFLSRTESARGDTERARELLIESLGRSPGDPFALAELVALTDDSAFLQTLEANFGVLDARFLVGQALLHHERWPEAIASFNFLIERLPEFREAYLMLAVALGSSSRLDDAVHTYREAIRFGVEPTRLSSMTVEIFRRWADAWPQQPAAQLFTAQVLHRHGRLREALARLEAMGEPSEELHSAVQGEIERLRAAIAIEPIRPRAFPPPK